MLNAQMEDAGESAAACLEADHARLDGLRALVLEAVEERELELAQVYLSQLSAVLRCHLRVEEDLVFPILERSVCHVGPVCVLRREHRDLEDRLTAMSAALDLGDTCALLDEHQAFVELLENHRGREERLLYPAIDRILDPVARAQLVRHIRMLL
jgi:hemerythrin-like domain-containing protein